MGHPQLAVSSHQKAIAARRPPGPRGLPWIGNALSYLRDPLGFLSGCAARYGDVVRLRLPLGNGYLVSHPADIERILRGRHEDFIKGQATRSFLGFLGQGLLTSEGESWRRQRKWIQPAFQSHQIARYGEVMVRCAEEMTASWRAGQTRDIHADLMRLTLRIIARAVFGLDVREEEAAEIGKSLAAVTADSRRRMSVPRIVQWLPTPLAWRFKREVRRLHETIGRILGRGRDNARGDLLDRLRDARDENGKEISDRQIHDECMTLLIAGHETTAIALAFAALLLAEHPQVQGKLAGELDRVLGDRLPTIEDVANLPYTDNVIKETLRLYPPAWAVNREVIHECEIGGYVAAKGTQLLMSQWIVHRDPRWFDSPAAFRPERWENDFRERLPRCAYFPFGDGPRVCVGGQFAMTEAILVLATILKRHRLEAVPEQRITLEPAITLRPRGAIRVRIAGRSAR